MEVPPPLPQRVRRVRARSSSEDNIPLAELARRFKMRDEPSMDSSEDNIPLAELARKYRLRDQQAVHFS